MFCVRQELNSHVFFKLVRHFSGLNQDCSGRLRKQWKIQYGIWDGQSDTGAGFPLDYLISVVSAVPPHMPCLLYHLRYINLANGRVVK